MDMRSSTDNRASNKDKKQKTVPTIDQPRTHKKHRQTASADIDTAVASGKSSTSSQSKHPAPAHAVPKSRVDDQAKPPCEAVSFEKPPSPRDTQKPTYLNPKISPAAYAGQYFNHQLRLRRRFVVDSLMGKIQECIERKFDALEAPLDARLLATTNSRPSSGFSSEVNIQSSNLKVAGQKRQLQNDGRGACDVELDVKSGEDRKKRPKRTSGCEPGIKFACPYMKFAPERFRNERTCCGPGWTEIHRLKQHLTRNHKLPSFKCNRCCERFFEDHDLKEHQRAAEPCARRDASEVARDLADGFDQEQERLLEKRLKMTSHEKWIQYYSILFCVEADPSRIPSPYHGVSDRGVVAAPIDEGSRYYIDFMKREMYPMIREVIEATFDRHMIGLDSKLKRDLQQELQDVPLKLHRTFENITLPKSPTGGDRGDEAAPPIVDVGPEFYEDMFQGIDFGDVSFSMPATFDPTLAPFESTNSTNGSTSSADSSNAAGTLSSITSGTSLDDMTGNLLTKTDCDEELTGPVMQSHLYMNRNLDFQG